VVEIPVVLHKETVVDGIDQSVKAIAGKYSSKMNLEETEMTKLELTEKEAVALIEILTSFLSDLKTERVGTDNREWHAEMVERETFVGDLIKRLGN
jgi:hypothetical protein